MNIIEVKDEYRNKKRYNGATPKFGITISNVDYIVKCGSNKHNISDWRVFSEYIASHFIASLNIPVHDVSLGIYEDKLVNVIVDFQVDGSKLRSFQDIRSTSLDTRMDSQKQPVEYCYSEVVHRLKALKAPDDFTAKMHTHFWNMVMVDAILANRDRHWGNWGYFVHIHGYGALKNRKIAPLYDNGGSLFPEYMYRRLIDLTPETDYAFFKVATIDTPNSVFRATLEDARLEKRTTYYEQFSSFWQSPKIAKFIYNFCKINTFEKIRNNILSIIEEFNTGLLTDIQKYFYIKVVCLRYLCILQQIPYDDAYASVTQYLGW